MKFKHKTDQEIAESLLLPDGEYQAFVYDAEDKDRSGNPLLTKSGVEKIDLTCQVYDVEGKPRLIRCVLTEAYIKILKHFCDVTDLQDKYNADDLTAADCKAVTKPFIVVLTTYEYTNKMGENVKTNNIGDFKSAITAKASETEPFKDEIPF